MSKLLSPLSNGDMYPPTPCSYLKWGVLGQGLWAIAYRLRPGDRYFESIKRQMNVRGPIPREVWGSDRRWEIAEQVSAILADACWGEQLSFHPDDPWSIVGKCEILNISDIDAVCRIEEKYSIMSPCHELWDRVREGLTIGDVVTYIANHTRGK